MASELSKRTLLPVLDSNPTYSLVNGTLLSGITGLGVLLPWIGINFTFLSLSKVESGDPGVAYDQGDIMPWFYLYLSNYDPEGEF